MNTTLNPESILDSLNLINTAYPLKTLRSRLGGAYNSFVQSQLFSKFEQDYSLWRTTGDTGTLTRMLDTLWDISHHKHSDSALTEIGVKAVRHLPHIIMILQGDNPRIPESICEKILTVLADNNLCSIMADTTENKRLLACVCVDRARAYGNNTVAPTDALARLLRTWTNKEVILTGNALQETAKLLFGSAWLTLYADELNDSGSGAALMKDTDAHYLLTTSTAPCVSFSGSLPNSLSI